MVGGEKKQKVHTPLGKSQSTCKLQFIHVQVLGHISLKCHTPNTLATKCAKYKANQILYKVDGVTPGFLLVAARLNNQ